MTTRVELLFGFAFPSLTFACYFFIPDWCYSWFCMYFLFWHAKLLSFIFSLFIFLLYSPTLFSAKYAFTTQVQACMFLYSTLHSCLVFFLMLLCISTKLRISLKTYIQNSYPTHSKGEGGDNCYTWYSFDTKRFGSWRTVIQGDIG